MAPNRSAFLTVAFVALFHPLLAFAQQAQPPTGSQPPWGWPGPWHMWSGGWEFWWILPLFMLFMMLICIAMFFFGHTSRRAPSLGTVGDRGPTVWAGPLFGRSDLFRATDPERAPREGRDPEARVRRETGRHPFESPALAGERVISIFTRCGPCVN